MAPRSPPPGSGTATPQASSPGEAARNRPSASTTLRAVAMACAATPSHGVGEAGADRLQRDGPVGAERVDDGRVGLERGAGRVGDAVEHAVERAVDAARGGRDGGLPGAALVGDAAGGVDGERARERVADAARGGLVGLAGLGRQRQRQRAVAVERARPARGRRRGRRRA